MARSGRMAVAVLGYPSGFGIPGPCAPAVESTNGLGATLYLTGYLSPR